MGALGGASTATEEGDRTASDTDARTANGALRRDPLRDTKAALTVGHELGAKRAACMAAREGNAVGERRWWRRRVLRGFSGEGVLGLSWTREKMGEGMHRLR